jgi:hypothetical protein
MLFWIHDAGGAGRCVLHLLGDTRLSAGFNPVYNRFPSIDGIHCHRSTLCRGRADSRCLRDTNGGVACRPNCVPFLEVKKPKASANKSPTRVLSAVLRLCFHRRTAVCFHGWEQSANPSASQGRRYRTPVLWAQLNRPNSARASSVLEKGQSTSRYRRAWSSPPN